MGYRKFSKLLAAWMLMLWAVPGVIWAAPGPSVVIHFENGQAFLSSKDKTKLREMFQHYAVGSESRVFVLGYTDAVGNANANYKLSRRRAQSVRREIVSSFAIDATIIMAMGKGEENPVADNRKAKGRALNRRAEIYLANTSVREPRRVYGPQDPHLPAIRDLVQAAEVLIKRQALNDAIRKLDEARTLGGDHYSDWHAVYGIAGYYGNAPNERIEHHCQAAIRLDPYNFQAREFLSRVQARRKFGNGDVSALMGRTAATAIPVTAVAQAYEYLRLFGVQPLSHRELQHRPVDAWECLDADGNPVVYHFDHTPVHAWAFGHQARTGPSLSVPATDSTPKAARDASKPAPVSGDAGALKTAAPAKDLANSGQQTIWESKVFQ